MAKEPPWSGPGVCLHRRGINVVDGAPGRVSFRVSDPDRAGQPWAKWGCPIDGCGQWFLGPWYLEWHTEAEHPGWRATYELLRPYPNQRMRVVYRQVEEPPAG